MEFPEADYYILTEGGLKNGFGHITRCLAILQAFEEIDQKCCLIINGEEVAKQILFGKKHLFFNWLSNKEEIVNYISKEKGVIIDSYKTSVNDLKWFSNKYHKIAYLDDNSRLPYPRGLVFNPTNFIDFLDFPNYDNDTYILGPEYILLRKTFWDVPLKKVKSNVENILITLGGTDIKNLTSSIFDVIKETHPNAFITIITNKNNQNLKEKQEINKSNCKLLKGVNEEQMCTLMQEADMAVTTSGQTVYELLRVGTPTIAISIIDNQIRLLNALKKAKYYENILDINDDTFWINFNELLIKFRHCNERQKAVTIGKKIVDGQGSRRLSNELIRKFSNLK